MALMPITTFPGWFLLTVVLLVIACGAFQLLNPSAAIDLLHRGEANDPSRRWWLNLWLNRWVSHPVGMRIFGALMIVGGATGLNALLIVPAFPK